MSELETIQIKACRIITGATKLVSFENLKNDTGFEPIKIEKKETHR